MKSGLKNVNAVIENGTKHSNSNQRRWRVRIMIMKLKFNYKLIWLECPREASH